MSHAGSSTATVVALTLLPAILSKVGARVDWPRRRSAESASRFWTWWSKGVIRHRVALLARGLKSILLPAKAVILNILSVAASYGLLVLVFQHGIGMQALWSTPATGRSTPWRRF